MDIKSNITNRAELCLIDLKVKISGSSILTDKMNAYKSQHGADPRSWPLICQNSANSLAGNSRVIDNYDLLINEFILKSQDLYKLTYRHQEICHCRTVTTETVVQSIKQDCRNLNDIRRATKAGTGCGTCVPNLELLLQEILR